MYKINLRIRPQVFRSDETSGDVDLNFCLNEEELQEILKIAKGRIPYLNK